MKRRQVGQQDAAQDQSDAHTAQSRHPLMEQDGPENGGKGRTQGAEKAGTVGADTALGHGLEGIAKAGAHHRQGDDDAPLAAGLGQAGRLKDPGGDEGIQAQKAHLQHAQSEAVRPVAGAVDGNDTRGIEKGREQRDALPGTQVKSPALAGQQGNAGYGDGGAEQTHGPGEPAVQGRLQQRHKDDGQVLQQRNRAGVHRFEGQHFAAHDQEKEEAHQSAPGHGAAVQLLYHFFPEQGRQQQKRQQKPHGQHIEGAHGAKAHLIEYKGRAAGNNHRRHQHLRFSLGHLDPSRVISRIQHRYYKQWR